MENSVSGNSVSTFFKRQEKTPITQKSIEGGKSRNILYINNVRTPKVFKLQPDNWNLVQNTKESIRSRRQLLKYYTELFSGQKNGKISIELLKSKFNIVKINENDEEKSIVMTIEEPRFDLYPANKNGFLDLCSSEFGKVNGNFLREIIKKDENFKSNLRLFLKEIGHKINYKQTVIKNGREYVETTKLILDFYGLSNVIYKNNSFIINNSSFKFDYNCEPISTQTLSIILKDLQKTKIPNEEQRHILRVSLVSIKWMNELCKMCNLPPIYSQKSERHLTTVENIEKYAGYF